MAMLLMGGGGGGAAKSASPFDASTGNFKATWGQELHNGSTLAILAAIAAVMIAIVVGVSVFFTKVHSNANLDPKDPNYNTWYHVKILQIYLGWVTAVVMVLLTVLAILVIVVFPGPQLTASALALKGQSNVRNLEAGIVSIANERIKRYRDQQMTTGGVTTGDVEMMAEGQTQPTRILEMQRRRTRPPPSTRYSTNARDGLASDEAGL